MAANPLMYPYGVPTVSGQNITVDLMLKEPTRITRYLSDISLQNLWVQDVFATPGVVEGGALLYDQLTANDLYVDGVANVEPGAEFPKVTSQRGAPKVALVEKFGGEFDVTDEARRRNDESAVRNNIVRVRNTIVKGLHTRGIAALDAAVTAHSRTASGVNWGTANSTAAASLTKNMEPALDFAKAQLGADTDELGVEFDTWIVNPAQKAAAMTYYGAANFDAVLAANGIRRMIATNRVAAGTAYAVESGQVGEMRFEQGLTTVVYREQSRQADVVQSSILPVFAVTNPYSVLKFTGLAG